MIKTVCEKNCKKKILSTVEQTNDQYNKIGLALMDLVGHRRKCKTMLRQERDWFPWNDVEQMNDIEVTHCDIHHYIQHPRGSANPSSCQTCNSYKKYNALETAIHIQLRFMESSPPAFTTILYKSFMRKCWLQKGEPEFELIYDTEKAPP